MPDIAMCRGDNCPRKKQCYRHTATPSEYRQAYMTTPLKPDGSCSYYWNNGTKETGDERPDET